VPGIFQHAHQPHSIADRTNTHLKIQRSAAGQKRERRGKRLRLWKSCRLLPELPRLRPARGVYAQRQTNAPGKG
jgi:hypothetical protein